MYLLVKYASICRRPDIASAISMVGRYQGEPGMVH